MKSIEQIFKEQTNLILHGICLTNTQFSMVIKPIDYSKVNIPIYLSMKYQFHFESMPRNVYNMVINKDRKQSIIVYEFFIQLGDRIKPLAFIVTSLTNEILTSGVAVGNFKDQKTKVLGYCIQRLREGVKIGSCSC